MSSNVGLSTPRGSGTSGYVQRNLSLLKPRDVGVGAPYSMADRDRAPVQRKPDEQILQHDRLREIEVKVLEYRDKVEEENEDEGVDTGNGKREKLTEEDLDELVDKKRAELIADMERADKRGGRGGRDRPGGNATGKNLKKYQVHELAEAKEKESEKLRRALGLKGDQLGEDGLHPMARQEERKRRDREKAAELEQQADHDDDGT
ncbi:hypothetical protein PV10_05604 [Exophiala mesophila]|uniref:CWF21 domain-containing protein n=1 Tax=Exophiala mesophila TaxID=212818 RepID=A0A0D1Z8K5_EXOME|nr:uncharacterized protein PV10_05604 [Exophiala mesophila]KIV91012.1 hypothetical protein PV10_05604 [Exophiala mesophila]